MGSKSAKRSERPGKAAATPTYSPKKATRQKQGWVPKGEAVSVHGRDIFGMVYVGTAPSINTHGTQSIFMVKCILPQCRRL